MPGPRAGYKGQTGNPSGGEPPEWMPVMMAHEEARCQDGPNCQGPGCRLNTKHATGGRKDARPNRKKLAGLEARIKGFEDAEGTARHKMHRPGSMSGKK